MRIIMLVHVKNKKEFRTVIDFLKLHGKVKAGDLKSCPIIFGM
jgi:hypothetical protein